MMRIALSLSLFVALSGCTGMLLGGGSSSTRPMGSDTRTSAQLATDNAITATVRSRLAGDAAIGRYDLLVQTANRRVSLYGTVGSYADRDRAVQLTQAVDGVSSVDSRIRVDTRDGH